MKETKTAFVVFEVTIPSGYDGLSRMNRHLLEYDFLLTRIPTLYPLKVFPKANINHLKIAAQLSPNGTTVEYCYVRLLGTGKPIQFE